MVSWLNRRRRWWAFLLIFVAVSLTGCAKRTDQDALQPARDTAKRDTNIHSGKQESVIANSADYLLSHEDYDLFRRDKSKNDILKDLHWRGNLEMAANHNGRSVDVISFGIFGGPHSDDPRADIICAIFVDDRFDKFVLWPDDGAHPIRIGDFTWLIRAVEAEPVQISEVGKLSDDLKNHTIAGGSGTYSSLASPPQSTLRQTRGRTRKEQPPA